MRTTLGRLRVPAATVAVLALVTLGAAPADASDHGSDPIGTLLGQLDQLPGVPGADGTTPVPAPADGSGTSSQSGDDSAPEDHAASEVAKVDLAGNDVADLGSSKATTRDDDSSSADSTLLALGGQEILGAHADSRGTGEDHAGDPLAGLCEASAGQLCLRVLYADALATDDGTTSHSESDSGVLSACLGGSNTEPTQECDGPVAAGVATSRADSTRDQGTGRTTGNAESDLVTLCLKQPGATAAGCALQGDVLHSESHADSGTGTPAATGGSDIAGLSTNGESQGSLDQPDQIAVQPGCVSPSAVCVDLNQGGAQVGGDTAGQSQDALVARALPDSPLEASADLSHTETLAHNDGGERAAGANRAPEVLGKELVGGPRSPGGSAGALAGVLPNTGGVWTGLLAGGLGAVGLGALLMAYSRRKAAGSLV